ncbi:hypothetical protein MTCD1_00255 [Colwellia marinimaniae]|uniref:Uncharacterized protein n=1 Tax=Colwellia marinimaniae TaxID=1513592 RepID=A0ABQ0MQP2_9GAMM|nr:hypothetical protein MTCD1_00255 [Colwellia marinimaniae]
MALKLLIKHGYTILNQKVILKSAYAGFMSIFALFIANEIKSSSEVG